MVVKSDKFAFYFLDLLIITVYFYGFCFGTRPCPGGPGPGHSLLSFTAC